LHLPCSLTDAIGEFPLGSSIDRALQGNNMHRMPVIIAPVAVAFTAL
jgi:hypothetical protein